MTDGTKTSALKHTDVFNVEAYKTHTCEYCNEENNDYGHRIPELRPIYQRVTQDSVERIIPSGRALRTKIVICTGCNEEVTLIFDSGYSSAKAAIQHQPGLSSFLCKYDTRDSYGYYPQFRSMKTMMRRFRLPKTVIHSYSNFLCPKSHQYRFGDLGDTVKEFSGWAYDRITRPPE
jgi:hypothetical protein